MPYELLNDAPATPHRMYSFLRLIHELESPDRQQLFDLVQPQELDPDDQGRQDVVEIVFENAVKCGLIEETSDATRRIVLRGDALEAIRSLDGFRCHMQRVVLGVTDSTKPNELFSLFSAWYAAQNADVIRSSPSQLAIRFNEQIYPGEVQQRFNETKFNGWRQWAVFLGLGWVFRYGARQVLIPSAYSRVKDALCKVSSGAETISMKEFVDRLGKACPELDGGDLFRRSYLISRSGVNAQQLSLMVSSALRALHADGTIKLVKERDAISWYLFPAQGQEFHSEVTHVQWGRIQ
jgi:hypothetical protein